VADDEVVMLVGGPFDGLPWKVSRERLLLTLGFDDGPAEHWPPPARRTGLASYRRTSPTTFTHCRTPTGVGDDNWDLPERQFNLEEDL
jgi:hypothetical protein